MLYPDDVGALDPEVLHHRSGVVGHPLVGDRTVGVGGPAVTLQLQRDHLPLLGERSEERRHPVDVHVGAVEQDERLALAVDLEIRRSDR